VDWEIAGVQGQNLGAAFLDKEMVVGICSGRLKLESGSFGARGSAVSLTGNADAGWEITTPVRPAVRQVMAHDPAAEQGDEAWVVCMGMLRAKHTGPGVVSAEGFYQWTNASSWSTPWWKDDAWQIDLWSPHYAAPGTSEDGLTHGTYSCWMTGQCIQDLGLTLQQALSGQLTVTRIDNGVTSPVTATLVERDGGVFIDIPDLTFSSPTLRIGKPASQHAPKRKRKKHKKGKKGKKGHK